MSSRKKLKMVASNVEMAAGEAARAGEASADFPAAPVRPDPEVRALAKRRKFNAAYKLAVLSEVDRLTEPGAIGGRACGRGANDSEAARKFGASE